MSNVAYVLGNGPSRDRARKHYDGVTYGCNGIHGELSVDILVVMDAWYQFEVIASGYPAEHDCLFGGWNLMPIEVSPESVCPPSYSQHEYNPKDRAAATDWCYYATSAEDYKKSIDEKYTMSYWKPDCGYVCWVGEGYRIKEVDYGVIPIRGLMPPSGAYALQEALKSGHDRVEVYGFDSIAGVFSTTSKIAYKAHDFEDGGVIQSRMEQWMGFYKTITEHYNEIEIIWHKK